MKPAIIELMRLFAVAVCLLAVTACSDKNPTAPAPVSERVSLSPGQTQNVDEASITLRFEGVANDSRCPGDAICIQGGDALVKIEVIPFRGTGQKYDLHTGSLEPVRHDDLTISLVELVPYPFSSLPPIKSSDYRATLLITR